MTASICSTSSSNNTVGDYEYVGNVNSNLICFICYAPFTSPVSAPCGHTYCKSCILQCLAATPEDSTSSCPIDRIPLISNNLMPAVKIITNMLDELVIFCSHKRLGCQWQGQRQNLNRHLSDECLCVRVKCELPACGKLIIRGELGAHLKECDYRTTECALCKKMLNYINLDAHRNECPAEAATCPYCIKELGRHELEHHTSSCPERRVSCLYAKFGCTWQGKLPDKEIIHTPECHYEAVKGFLALQEARNEKLVEEIQSLKEQVTLLRQEIFELKNDSNNNMAVSAEHATTMALGFPPDVPVLPLESLIDSPTLEHLNQILTENEILRNEIERLSANAASVELKQNMNLIAESNRLREEMQSVRAMCQAVQTQLVYSLEGRTRKDVSSGPSQGVPVTNSFNPPLVHCLPASPGNLLSASPIVGETNAGVTHHHVSRGQWRKNNGKTSASAGGELLSSSTTANHSNAIMKL